MFFSNFYNSLKKDLGQIYRYRYVISSYVETNLRLRYRRSFVGFLWTIIAPLLQYLIIAYVFKYASHITDNNYFAYFFTGAVIFNAFSVTLLRAPAIMLVNEIYIKKIFLPKSIYVLNTCLYELTNLFFSGVVLFTLGILIGAIKLSAALLIVPFSVILLFITLLGLSAILSIGGVYFRDLAYIMPPIMQASFFVTPIIYRLDTFPLHIQRLIGLNPFYHMIETIRVPITQGILASGEHYLFSIIAAASSISLGYWMIKHFENRIIFKL